MAISFNEANKVFKLDACGVTYAMGVQEQGYLVHLYYGAAIPDTDLMPLMGRDWFDSLSPLGEDSTDPAFSLDIQPLEYPANGAGDFRSSALSVRGKDGNTVTDLRYVGHRILPGKPGLPGLPASFDREGKAETLEIQLGDPVTGVQAFLSYTVFEDSPVLARSVRLENAGEAPVFLERAYSACFDLPDMDLDMLHVYGRWAKENTAVRHPLQHGIQAIRSKRGMTGPNHNPFVLLPRSDATEDAGEVWGVSLVYSGNFALDIEVDTKGCPRLLAGINPDDFRWKLEPGEAFTAPEVLSVYAGEGVGSASRAFHRFLRDHLMRSAWTHQKRPLLINSWEAAYFDFDGDKLVDFARHAKDLGIEMLVMDDGWFGNRCDDYRALGDWQVNEKKLGGTLKQLVDRVNELGVAFGIWYEPEMINPDSDLYRAHPDWAIQAPGRGKSLSRHQCVLDMTRQDVRDYIFGEMEKVISSANIAYIKWDCNRHISEAASAQLPADRQGEFFHRYVLGVYDLMDRVTTRFPQILLENCSSGGGRFDPGMLYYSPQIWASDNTDPIERLSIQFGASLVYPVSAMGAHVSASPRTGLATKAAVALCGTFGYELDPRKLTEEEKAEVRREVADYHKYYDLIHEGDFYRLTAPTEDPFVCDWEFVSPDKNEVLYTRVIMRQPENVYQVARLRGLDPAKLYRDEETGRVCSGALLMHAGLPLPSPAYTAPQTGSSVLRHLVACGENR